MRRLIPAAALLALFASACGDGGAGTTTAATTTTTAEASTTTEDPVAYRVTLATILAGEWVGEWRNTTYGSTGPVAVDVRVDGAAHTATLTIDLGGAVFGEGDPEPFELTVDLSAAPPYAASSPAGRDHLQHDRHRGLHPGVRRRPGGGHRHLLGHRHGRLGEGGPAVHGGLRGRQRCRRHGHPAPSGRLGPGPPGRLRPDR